MTLPPERPRTFDNAPMDALLAVLLRQLKRPLASAGYSLTDAEAERLARDRLNDRLRPADITGLLAALATVVEQSKNVLARQGLAFPQSLDTPMDAVPGWETTAEFLEIANDKSNAELRISLGTALTLALGGERRFAPYLLYLASGDYGDETVIARRTLMFAADIDPVAADWLERVKRWLAS